MLIFNTFLVLTNIFISYFFRLCSVYSLLSVVWTSFFLPSSPGHLLIVKPQCLDQSSSSLIPIPYCLFDKLFIVDSKLCSSDSGHPCLTPLPTLGLVLPWLPS